MLAIFARSHLLHRQIDRCPVGWLHSVPPVAPRATITPRLLPQPPVCCQHADAIRRRLLLHLRPFDHVIGSHLLHRRSLSIRQSQHGSCSPRFDVCRHVRHPSTELEVAASHWLYSPYFSLTHWQHGSWSWLQSPCLQFWQLCFCTCFFFFPLFILFPFLGVLVSYPCHLPKI